MVVGFKVVSLILIQKEDYEYGYQFHILDKIQNDSRIFHNHGILPALHQGRLI